MLKAILALIVVAIIGFAIAASMQPDEFSVSRNATFNTTPDKIYPHINNLQAWNAWSPWAKLDPNAKTTFEGPAEGVGAKMLWDGNHEVGKGAMTIIESQPNERVKFQLDFEKPMAGTSYAEFTLKPQGTTTEVTWSMEGKNNFIAKAMSLVMDCEAMISEQFDKGLASLKGIAEAQ